MKSQGAVSKMVSDTIQLNILYLEKLFYSND